MTVEFAFQHGWGLDPSFFDSWQHSLADEKTFLYFADRGYFSKNPSFPSFTHQNSFKILVVHSFGLHLVPLDFFSKIDFLVIASSFLHFHPTQNSNESEKSKQSHSLLYKKCLKNPEKALLDFYQSCGLPPSFPLPKNLDNSLLLEDLKKLDQSIFPLETLFPIPRILIFHAKDDAIVPIEKGKELFASLPNAAFYEFPKGGHGLFSQNVSSFLKEKIFAIKNSSFKEKISKNFSLYPKEYDSFGYVQKQAANILCEELKKNEKKFPQGDLLEIGCGTGFVSQFLAKTFENQKILFSDLSPQMVEFTKQKLPKHPNFSFQVLDGETLFQPSQFAGIVSGMTFQWFEHFSKAVVRLVNSLKPEGFLIFSYLDEKSFPEWKQVCQEASIRFTGNKLPEEDLLMETLEKTGKKSFCFSKEFAQEYVSPLDFFHHLKKTGTSTSKQNFFLSPLEWKKLFSYWKKLFPQKTVLTYSITYVLIQNCPKEKNIKI